MRYLNTLLATSIALPFFPSTDAIVKPKPKPPPGIVIPFINTTAISTTPRYIPTSNVISTTSDSLLFGFDLSSSDVLTAITSDSSVTIYETNNDHQWKEIQTLQYSAKEMITSVTICHSTVAVAINENLCDDLDDCQIYTPQMNFVEIENGKIQGIKSYGGSYLRDLLAPAGLDSSLWNSGPYQYESFEVACSGDALIATSTWRNQNSSQRIYGAVFGTKVSSPLTSSFSRFSSGPSYQFQKVDFSEFVTSTDVLSVAMFGSDILLASLSASMAAPTAHFFSLQKTVSTNSSLTSTPLSFVCSVSGGYGDLTEGSMELTTALNSNYAVIGLSHLSEVYVYTLANQTSGSLRIWKSVGILRSSDSFAGDLFGYSVSISSTNILVGAPHAISFDEIQSGAVYIYQFNSTSSRWWEEKLVAERAQSSSNMTLNTAFGSRVSSSNYAIFICDVPRSLHMNLEKEVVNESASDAKGQVYILWTSTSGYHQKESTDDSIWNATVMWALVLVSIPVAVAFALIGYRYRDSMCISRKSADITDAGALSSTSAHPSPFFLTSCVDTSNPENQGASILKLSPMVNHVFRSSIPRRGNSDVESNCSSPVGQETKGNWKFTEMMRGRSNYQQLKVPDSPSCRSEVSTVSMTSEGSAGPNKEIPKEENWFTRLFSWQSSVHPSDNPSLPSRSRGDGIEEISIPRSCLQSPTPPAVAALPSRQHQASNPMISPSVVE